MRPDSRDEQTLVPDDVEPLATLDELGTLAPIDITPAHVGMVDVDERDVVAGRFWSKVVRGPDVRDCWLWVGAIADDGYGRFWVGPDRVVSAHRFVYEITTGEVPPPGHVIEHAMCDNPICVRFVDDAGTDHLQLSTQAENLARMGRLGRGGGAWTTYRWASTDRASLAARSRRLRAAVMYGWDADLIRAALDEPAPGQLTLW